MLKIIRVLGLMLATGSVTAQAQDDFDILPGTTQADFRAISEDVSATLNYKALGPAEATGVIGFGIGAYAAYTPTENEDAWRRVTGSDVSAIGMAGVVVHKGLPFNLDIGAFYSVVPETDVNVYGAELRYAILEGGVASPALAVRGSHTRTSGSEDFEFSTTGIDAEVSKGFTVLTPYVGAGYQWSVSDPNVLGLSKESFNQARVYAGLRLSLLFLELTPEIERNGDNTSYNLRLGFSL